MKKKMSIEDQVKTAVEIVLASGEPMTSLEVDEEFKKRTGESIGQTSMWRRLNLAAGAGQVAQNSKKRWVAPNNADSDAVNVAPDGAVNTKTLQDGIPQDRVGELVVFLNAAMASCDQKSSTARYLRMALEIAGVR